MDPAEREAAPTDWNGSDDRMRGTPHALEIPAHLVTERVLLAALREHDAAIAAEAARSRAEFLADASLRLGASLDQELTYAAIAGIALPGLDAWCVVDVIEATGGLRRLAVVHPDEGKEAVARTLARDWLPSPDDPIGVPAVARERRPVLVTDGADAALAAAARTPDTLRALRWLGAGSLLVVPIVANGVLLGAITYISRPGAEVYTTEHVYLAEALASRCAQALEAARLYAAARAARDEADAARADADAARAEADVARAEADTARAAAEEANAIKAQFLRTMSHELRTPLNAIGGYAQLMELGIHGPVTTDQHADLTRIQTSQRHLVGLVGEVLDFAQLETGTLRFEIVDVHVRDALVEAGDLVEPLARAKGLSLELEAASPSLVVRADVAKLRQILVNLLGNAVKFTDCGGHIRVRCAVSDEAVALSVADTGIGIAVADLERIFAPFVQVDRRHTRPYEGVGLGLSISRDLARGMGGELTAESTPGVGSRFTLTLPRV